MDALLVASVGIWIQAPSSPNTFRLHLVVGFGPKRWLRDADGGRDVWMRVLRNEVKASPRPLSDDALDGGASRYLTWPYLALLGLAWPLRPFARDTLRGTTCAH